MPLDDFKQGEDMNRFILKKFKIRKSRIDEILLPNQQFIFR